VTRLSTSHYSVTISTQSQSAPSHSTQSQSALSHSLHSVTVNTQSPSTQSQSLSGRTGFTFNRCTVMEVFRARKVGNLELSRGCGQKSVSRDNRKRPKFLPAQRLSYPPPLTPPTLSHRIGFIRFVRCLRTSCFCLSVVSDQLLLPPPPLLLSQNIYFLSAAKVSTFCPLSRTAAFSAL
jgi:hypothetical protein